MNETKKEEISTTSRYSPSREDYAKWYTDLRENLEKRIIFLETQSNDIEISLKEMKKEVDNSIMKNYKADIKIKNLFWWLLLLSPFVMLVVFMLGFYISGGRDKIIDALRYIILGLGITGIIEMIFVGYLVKKHDEEIKKIKKDKS